MMDVKRLQAAGIDYEEGVNRFSGNREVYEKYLRGLPELSLVAEVGSAIQRCEYQQAFQACHKLKAYVGNLSIHELYDIATDLAEWLRVGRSSVLRRTYMELEAEYLRVVREIEEAQQGA